MVTKKTLTKKLKGQVIDDFIDLQKERDALRKQLDAAAKRPASAMRETQAVETQAVASTEGLTPGDVVQSVTQAGLQMQTAFDSINAEYLDVVKQLDLARTALQVEQKRISDLHGTEVLARSNEQLLTDYDTKRTEIQGALADLRDEIEEQRTDWQAEQLEFADDQVKQRQREEDEFQFNLRVRRRNEADRYEQQRQEAVRDFENMINARTAALDARETGIQECENELIELRAFRVTADDVTAAAVVKAEAIVRNSLKRQHEHAVELLSKDAEAANALAKAEIDTLRTQLTQSQAQVQTLEAKVEKANALVAEISKAGLDSASGQATLTKLQELGVGGMFAAGGDNGSRKRS